MDEVNARIAEHYNTTFEKSGSFVLPKDPEPILRSFLFLLHELMKRGLTLSAICPSDFKSQGDVLFLKKDTHVTPLVEGHFDYQGSTKCFSPGKRGRHSLTALYHSVALFAYYLWTHKKVDTLKASEMEKLKGTKVYYFIRNATERHPILLYL